MLEMRAGILLTVVACFAVVMVSSATFNADTHPDLISSNRAYVETIPYSTTPGNVYYVSPTGNDSNPGTYTQPWATPGYGARQLAPGDTLVILGGRYVLSVYEDIVSPQSGTENAWITIKGSPEQVPVLAGKDNLLTGIDLGNKSYIKIENIEITSDNGSFFRDGIEALDGTVSHVILQNVSIHHMDEFGLNIGDANDLLIQNCTFSYCGFGCAGGPAGSEGGWRNVSIKNCRFSYAGRYYQGIYDNPDLPYDRPDGFGIESSAGPIEISDTISEHNLGDGIDSKAENTTLINCIVANNRCDGIKLWGNNSKAENCLIYGRGDGNTTGTPWAPLVISTENNNSRFELVNLAIDDFVGNNYLMHVQYDYPTTNVHLTVRNTIFCGRGDNSPIYLADSVNFTMEYNLYYFPNSSFVLQHGSIRNYESSQVGEIGTGNRYGDPMFAHPAFGIDGDYHLLPGSPAIDNGTSNGAPQTDIEGNSRPYGAGFDMGPYEMHPSVCECSRIDLGIAAGITLIASINALRSRIWCVR
jgi:hypothetical protein